MVDLRVSENEDPKEAAWRLNPVRPPFLCKLGIELEEVSKARVVATMPVEGNTQGIDTLHGGATTSLIETLASIGAEVSVEQNQIVMGQSQTSHFLGVASTGRVRGVATPLHRGRTTHVWDVDVSHVESGKRVATGRVTIAVRERRARE